MSERRAWFGRRAIEWVLDEAEGVPTHLVSTLAGLARHAQDDGSGAAPSIETLTGYTRKSKRQVKYDLDALVDKKLIKVSDDQSRVKHIRADRRPVVYDLAIPKTGATTCNPLQPEDAERGATDCTSPELRGAMDYRTGCNTAPDDVQPIAPEKNFEKNLEKINPSLSDDRPSVPAPRQAPTEDRERGEEFSTSNSNLGPLERLAVKHGSPEDLAADVVGYIEATNIIDGPGWWYHASGNNSLTLQVQKALAGLDRCVRCNDEGQVWSDQFNSMLPCGTCGGSQDDTRCAKHPGQRAARCGSCRADRLAAGVERPSDRQPRTSERGGYRAAKVNMEPGARTAAMARRRQAASEASPGWAVRPDGSRILVNSHDPNIDWETPL